MPSRGRPPIGSHNFPSLQSVWYSAEILWPARSLSMRQERYSLIIANRSTGTMRQLTISVRSVLMGVAVAALIPVTSATLARRSSHIEVAQLRLLNARLEVENASYRATATDLSEDMKLLTGAMSELSGRAKIDSSMLRSMQRLPDRADTESALTAGFVVQPSIFTHLRSLLGSLDDRLERVRRGVAYREALAEVMPIGWPADGWISGTYGYRKDPFTGERDFHPAVDISAEKGRPVYATATGRVFSAKRNGAYGNLVEIDHGFDLTTRYGHLGEFEVSVGDTVQRGDVIGYIGDTGRATGYHVHYEIWSADRTIDPMRLLSQTSTSSAN